MQRRTQAGGPALARLSRAAIPFREECRPSQKCGVRVHSSRKGIAGTAKPSVCPHVSNRTHPMNETTFWRGRYAEAFARALRGAAQPGRIACGFTNNVDRVADVDGAHLSRLLAQAGVALPHGRGPLLVRTPAELLAGMAAFVRDGRGGELTVLDAGLYRWMEAHFAFRGAPQLGGTAAQSAHTLARLGFDTLLHVTSLSPQQAALLDNTGRTLIATGDGLQRPADAARPADPTMVHVIFEYAAGTEIAAGGVRAAAPAANRIIVSYDPINGDLAFDPHYVAAVADPAAQVGAVMLSGYNQVSTLDLCRVRIGETVAMVRGWKAARPGLLAHLELGATPDGGFLAAILEGFAGEVDSIGLNADELNDVLHLWGEPHADGAPGLVDAVRRMHAHVGCARINVHTQELCVTVTQGDPRAEQDALLFGSLVAGTRARLADFPRVEDVARVLGAGEVAPRSLGLLADACAAGGAPPEGIARCGAGWLVAAPTLAVSNPAGIVGLGDSYTAGVLGVLGKEGTA